MTFLGPVIIGAAIAIGLLSDGDCDKVAWTDAAGIEWTADECRSEGLDLSGFGRSEFTPQPAPVPEPSTWALEIAGFAMAGAVLRRNAIVRRKPL